MCISLYLGIRRSCDETHQGFWKCKVKRHSNTLDNIINEVIVDKTMTNLVIFGMWQARTKSASIIICSKLCRFYPQTTVRHENMWCKFEKYLLQISTWHQESKSVSEEYGSQRTNARKDLTLYFRFF